MSQSLEGKGACTPAPPARWLMGEMAVNSHPQLVSLNQTTDAEPTTHVGPPSMRGYPGWEPSLDFRRRPD